MARYDPFGVDVPLNFDNTHSLILLNNSPIVVNTLGWWTECVSPRHRTLHRGSWAEWVLHSSELKLRDLHLHVPHSQLIPSPSLLVRLQSPRHYLFLRGFRDRYIINMIHDCRFRDTDAAIRCHGCENSAVSNTEIKQLFHK